MIRRTKIFKVVLETAFNRNPKKDSSLCVFTWDLIRNKYIYVVADDIEGALLYVRKNFDALTSGVEFDENEVPIGIKGISLYQDSVYA